MIKYLLTVAICKKMDTYQSRSIFKNSSKEKKTESRFRNWQTYKKKEYNKRGRRN